jgi:hypothetical protein
VHVVATLLERDLVLGQTALGAGAIGLTDDLDGHSRPARHDLDVADRAVEMQRPAVGHVESLADDVVGGQAEGEGERECEQSQSAHEQSSVSTFLRPSSRKV